MNDNDMQTMQTTTVTLTITWDNQDSDHPANWDWRCLLDLGPNESVVVETE